MGGAAATATRLLQVTIASGSKTTVATGLSNPYGIALSADGLSVFVTEANGADRVTQVGGREGVASTAVRVGGWVVRQRRPPACCR